MKIADLIGWTPIRVYWQQSQLFVDWANMGNQRFTEPFFEQSIGKAMRHPFNMLFRHQTSIEALSELQEIHRGLPPSGFIFHMSRCGSTLISQLLAVLPQNIVISEAASIDSIIRANFRDPRIKDEQRITWLRGLINALGQQRHAGEKRLFIKLDSWHTLDLPLIERAFPGVPWIFVYRHPVEVMVSHIRGRGSQLIPGAVPPALLSLDLAEIYQMSLEEYAARVLATFCRAALQSQPNSHGRLVNYRQLPEMIWSWLPEFFRVTYSEAEIERMREATQFDAKSPSMTFANDTEEKRREATDEVRRLAERWIGPLYEQLETLREAQETVNAGS